MPDRGGFQTRLDGMLSSALTLYGNTPKARAIFHPRFRLCLDSGTSPE
jgi:hypothetical protein